MAISKNSRTGRQAISVDSSCLKKHNSGSGAGMNSKRDKKARGGSQTAGNIKSEDCKASTNDKHMAKCSRSYKHRDYRAWLAKTWKTNFNSMSFEEYREAQNEAN